VRQGWGSRLGCRERTGAGRPNATQLGQGTSRRQAQRCRQQGGDTGSHGAFATAGRERLTDAQTLAIIRAIHAELKGAYGSRAWCAV